MKISPFKSAIVVYLVCWLAQVGNAIEEYEAGIDYKIFEDEEVAEITEGISSEPEKITVIEYFSYGCTACRLFEQHISKWLVTKEDDVEFRREAVVFQRSWAQLAKAYYVAIELDVLDVVHKPMFEAVHLEKRNMDDPRNIQQLFEDEAEIDSEAFRAAYNDQNIVDLILDVHETVRSMNIKNTPTVVVDGRFLVNTRTAQSRRRIFPIVDFLVKKVRSERESVSSIETKNELDPVSP